MNETYQLSAARSANKPTFAALGLLLICFAVGLAYSLQAEDPLEDDSVHHYLMSKWLLRHGNLVVNFWGRPAVTLAYFPAAQFGFFWCRLTSLAICLLAAWYTFRLAGNIGFKYAWLAVPLVFFQNQFFRLSTDLLTEPLFSLIVICAVGNYIFRRHSRAAILFSISAAARPEGFFFIILFGIVLIVEALLGKLGSGKKGWVKFIGTSALLLCVPAVWSIAGGLIHGGLDLLWLTKSNSWDTLRYKYGSDGVLHYLLKMNYAVGIIVLAPAIAGMAACFRRGRIWIVPTLWIFFFVLHTYLRTSGYYASGGYPRYFAAVAPLMGLMAVAGVDRISRSLRWLLFSILVCAGLYWGIAPFLNETLGRIPRSNLGSAIGRNMGSFILFCATAMFLAIWLIFLRRTFRSLENRHPVRQIALPIILAGLVAGTGCSCLIFNRPAGRSLTYVSITEFGEWLRGEYPSLYEDLGSSGPRKTDAKLLFPRWYLHMRQGWDPYDESRFSGSFELDNIKTLPAGSIVVWDSDFGPGESRMSEERLDEIGRLKPIKNFFTKRSKGRSDFSLKVYEVTDHEQHERETP